MLGALAGWLPEGIPLGADQWQRRHRAIMTILWAHAVALPFVALVAGKDVAHAVEESLPVLVCAIAATPSRLGDRLLGRGSVDRARAVIAAVGLVASSAVLVHVSGGLVEMHFHFFVVVAIVTLYQDWAVFLSAILFVLAHHGIVGTMYPHAVYNHSSAWNNPWQWAALHAGFVLAASAAQVTAWRFTEDQYRRAEAGLEARDRRFRSLIENSSDGITVMEPDGAITFDSQSVATILGLPAGSRVGSSVFDFIHPDDRVAARALLAEMTGGTLAGTTSIELRGRHGDGSWRSFEARVTNLMDTPDIEGIVLNFRDVTERKLLESRLTHRAFHDPLTELPNRALLLDRIEHAIATQKRTGELLAVLFIDLDDFKTVNDGLGHGAGDQVLCTVGQRLLTCLREADTCARLGGDEFGILLEGLDDPGEAYDIGARALEVLGDPITTTEGVTSLSASLGIVVSSDTQDPAALIRDADLAMYQAKGEGKGRFAIFEVGMHDAVVERLALRADLNRAVERREFVVHYQPIVDLRTQVVVGAEALVRWDHPSRGLLPPSDFLPVAEETGLISVIGSQVLARACADAATWPAGPSGPLGVSVNMSASQLKDPSLDDEVRGVLGETRLEPAALTLEITETLLMEEPERAADVLREVKATGVSIALDDFGTGYSSLSYLNRFPVDTLKIDKSFVDALAGAGTAYDASLVDAITGLGEMLGLQVTAEGIETTVQVAELLALGCHLGQGFHFARPMPNDAFVDHVRDQTGSGSSARSLVAGRATAPTRGATGSSGHPSRPIG